MGDAHVSNGQDLRRFDWLGHAIARLQPDYIVLMGDFLTLNSLSMWDKNKRMLMEGRRYQLEIDAGRSAIDRMLRPMTLLQGRQKKQKKKVYNPSLIYVEGNHEDRLTRYLETDPTFDGTVSIQQDLLQVSDGWTWVPYRSWYYIDGVGFTHVPFNKAKPVSGLDLNQKCTNCTINSTVYGHTHEARYSTFRKHGQDSDQHILNAGCFFEVSQDEDYVDGRVKNYWRGVMILDTYSHGQFDLSTYSMATLEYNYNNNQG